MEEPTLARLVEWRGDDENGKTVLEDVFREVIVISDDEDSDAESDVGHAYNDRDTSVEILSSNAAAAELQTKPLDYADRSLREAPLDLSDDDAPPGFRFVPEPTKRTRPRSDRIDRRGFSRYEAWNRARFRYREKALAGHQANIHTQAIRDSGPSYVGGPSLRAPERPHYEDFQPPNANISERTPLRSRHAQTLSSSSVPLSVDCRGTSFPSRSQPQRPSGAIVTYRNSLEVNPQDRVLPSIEFPQSPSSTIKSPGHRRIYTPIKRSSDALQTSSLTSISRPHERESTIIDLTNMRDEMPKRRRFGYQEPSRDFSHHGPSRMDGHISDPVPSISLLSPESGRRPVPTYKNQLVGQHLSAGGRHKITGHQLERATLHRASPLSRLPGSNVVRYVDSEYVTRQEVTSPLCRDGLEMSSNQRSSQPNHGNIEDRSLNAFDAYSRPDHLYQVDHGMPNMRSRRYLEETERQVPVRRPQVITTPRGSDHDQKRKDIYSPDFVRPVNIYDPIAPYRLVQRGPVPTQVFEPVSRPIRYSPILSDREGRAPRREVVSRHDPYRPSLQAPIDLSPEIPQRARDNIHVFQEGMPADRSKYTAVTVSQYDAPRGAIIDSTRCGYSLPRIENLEIRSSRTFLGP